MGDTNSDSDDGAYCELKQYIKQARMNLRKVKRKESLVDKEDNDSENIENDAEDERSEENDEVEQEELPKDPDRKEISDKENIADKYASGSESEQESEKSHENDNDNESKEDCNEEIVLQQDSETEKPHDVIESDKVDLAMSDGEIVEMEQEVILSDEEEDIEQTDKDNNNDMQESDNNRVELNTKSDEEENFKESDCDNETSNDNDEVIRSVNELKNCFETRSDSTSNYGVFRTMKPYDNNEDETNIIVDENTNDKARYQENQNTDYELQATDDESSTVDAFNIQYRYALRYSKSIRRSQQPNQEINDGNTESEADNVVDDSIAYNKDDNRISTYNEYLQIDRDTIERLYDFIFPDPWDDLKQILESKRSSKSSTEIDGIMKSPQQIFYTNEASIEEVTNEHKLEDNIESIELIPEVDLRLNTRALAKEATTYELERFDKNLLIIFNQERILGYKPRLGTRQDVEALTRTFSPYGFDVIEHVDLNRDEILEELNRLTEINFTEYGCLAIAVLTHGSEMDGLRAKDRLYYQSDIIKYLKTSKNPTLVTKPKVLIIQACRGSESTFAVAVGRVGKITTDYDDVDDHRTYTLPVEADILIVHSTFAGKTSHRDELNGTWFIQTLCDKINDLAMKEDLESIITEVKKEVAIEKSLEEYNRRTFDFDTNKQMPVIVSTLIRKLYLKKMGETSIENAQFGEVVTDGTNPVSSSRLPNCLCVFDRFEYMKNCMRYFLEDNEDDVTGRSFLDVAETLSEGYEFHAVKEQLSKAMSNHLLTMAKDCDYYKYLYFYKDFS